jgi:5-dehydro-2-deoxygluconokinase
VGRTIFGEVARAWLSKQMSDEDAIEAMAKRFAALDMAWQKTRDRKAA